MTAYTSRQMTMAGHRMFSLISKSAIIVLAFGLPIAERAMTDHGLASAQA